MHTHYDNLRVARNAPPEVIRAAYRALAQRYHPDLNPSPDASRVMRILNESYAALSDPKRRAEHDAWIEEQLIREALDEALAGTSERHGTRGTASREANDGERPAAPRQRHQPNTLARLNHWLGTAAGTKFGVGVIAGTVLLAWLWLTRTPTNSPLATSRIAAPGTPATSTSQAAQPGRAPSYAPLNGVLDPQSGPQPSTPASLDKGRSIPSVFSFEEAQRVSGPVKTAMAWSPNGKPWPTRAAYLEGFQRRAVSGLSTLTVDNTSGGADVYVKLCRASADRCDGLRHVFIPLGATFTLSNVTPGTYDIRYRSLDDGSLAKSEPIQLMQVEEDRGIRYSRVRITLYRVAGGNTTFESLPEDKF